MHSGEPNVGGASPLLRPRRHRRLHGPHLAGKKLLEAARQWCAAAQGPDQLAEDAAALGIDLPDGLQEPVECLVLPENWDAVRVFCAAGTQWRMGPNGELLGLDHGAARAVAKGMAIKWRRVFPAVALIENEVVRLWTAKARSARSGT